MEAAQVVLWMDKSPEFIEKKCFSQNEPRFRVPAHHKTPMISKSYARPQPDRGSGTPAKKREKNPEIFKKPR
jgi:hypothetical protein